jgi:hypothetical protein
LGEASIEVCDVLNDTFYLSEFSKVYPRFSWGAEKVDLDYFRESAQHGDLPPVDPPGSARNFGPTSDPIGNP